MYGVGGKGWFVRKGQLWGFYSHYGSPALPVEYERLEVFSEDMILGRKSGKWGVAALDGGVAIPFQYTAFKPHSYNLYLVQKAGKMGAINDKGETGFGFTHNPQKSF